MVALASGFARSPRSLAGVRIRDRRLRPAARSRQRSIVLRRVCAHTPKTRLPGVAPRLRRRATRRLRRLSLPSSPPAVCTPADPDASASPVAGAAAVGFAFASPDADAVAFPPASSEEVSGRVASRPGYPAEPAARSRPFGRVSLASPLASLAARSPCPAVRSAHRRLPSRRRRGLRRHSGRSDAAASPLGRYAPGALRRRGPTAHPPRRLTSGSGPGTVLPIVDLVGLGLSHGPGPATLSHPTQRAASTAPTSLPLRPTCLPATFQYARVLQNHARDVPGKVSSI